MKEAESIYRQVLEIDPDQAEANHLLGAIACQDGRYEIAVQLISKSILITPDIAEYHSNLGAALEKLGRLDNAAASFHRAIALKPDFADAHGNLGNALQKLGRLEDAVASYHKALALGPDTADTHSNLGNALEKMGLLEDAVASYHKALALNPNAAETHSNLGNALEKLGRLEDAVASYHKALSLKPDFAVAHSNLLLAMQYGEVTSDKLFQEHLSWNENHGTPLQPQSRQHHHVNDPEKRLNVGFVSADFRTHSVGFFVESLFAAHDRQAFAIFCYSNTSQEDATSNRLRTMVEGWRNIVALDDQAVVDAIRDDQIDILVDLSGHTAGNRLLMFTRKPAPLQVTWLGYPDTSGLATIDYRFTDDIVDPPDLSGNWNAERLIRLPNGFHCYRPCEDAPDLAPSPRTVAGHITFASFNNLVKVTPAVVHAWALILKQVPGSRLVLKHKSLTCQAVRQRYLSLLKAENVDQDRLTLLPHSPSTQAHLAEYGQIDIALDPFPYNGTTTTCEAMWMGVPVVTLLGGRHAARVGASLLTTIGQDQLIAKSVNEYVETAVALALNPDRLNTIRCGLRGRMQNSPLCDPEGFARDMERSFRSIWREWCGNPATANNDENLI